LTVSLVPREVGVWACAAACGSRKAAKPTLKKRNKAKKYATGGKVSSASKRADGCAVKGKTKGKMV
jgi:hypothetical protein